jgi:DNA-binding MarR family transcriptional regulator
MELIQGEKPVFEAIIQGLTPQQIALLKAVAKEPSRFIMSMNYMKRHHLNSIGGIQSAAKKLEQLDCIEREQGATGGRWRVVDPLLGRWLTDYKSF